MKENGNVFIETSMFLHGVSTWKRFEFGFSFEYWSTVDLSMGEWFVIEMYNGLKSISKSA